MTYICVYVCMRRKYSEKILGRGCLRSGDGEERRKRTVSHNEGGKNLPKKERRENINMKNHNVSVAEEGESPHRQLYK